MNASAKAVLIGNMIASLMLAASSAVLAQGAASPAQPAQLGALSPANLAKPRPKPPFDLTGTWLHDNSGGGNSWKFVPPAFKLTPEAQAHYDAGQKATKEGKVYRDDIGQCWPAGMPLIMTRVWPIAMVQLPTAIYMTSAFMNSLRIVYLDGRSHSNPDIVVPSFNGESIGRWEENTLVVDTKYFPGHHHWMDQGGASIPASDQLRIIERIRMVNENVLEIEFTMTDPKSWEGEWKTTKRWNRVHDDITQAECWPDLNDHISSTTSSSQVR
jgi:hypothetical protein